MYIYQVIEDTSDVGRGGAYQENIRILKTVKTLREAQALVKTLQLTGLDCFRINKVKVG